MNLTEEHWAILRLFRSKGVGPSMFYDLLAQAGCAVAAVKHFSRFKKEHIQLASLQQVKDEAALLAQKGGRFIFIGTDDYPPLLQQIDAPPPVLSAIGNVALLHRPCVAMVGMRNASFNGKQFTHDVAEHLAAAGVVVVSGMARGIDTAAHVGALKGAIPQNGRGALPLGGTIAVLAGGIDHIYPPENSKLYHTLCERGLVLSEMPLGTPPSLGHFPRRNRIVSGVSQAVCVAECAQKSGSLITARFALEQNREVLAVPGFPLDVRSSGPNGLIKQGAHVLESAADVLALLNLLPHEDRLMRPQDLFEQNDDNSVENTREYSVQNADRRTEPQAALEVMPEEEPAPCLPEEVIYALVSASPTHQNDIIRDSNLSAADAILAITQLEIAGKIYKAAGDYLLRR